VPVKTDTELVGIKDAIRSLNKIEPGLRKQFAAEANDIAKPAIEEAARRYKFVGWGETRVQGVARTWAGPAVNGRKIFPWSYNKAVRGLKVKLDADRRATSVILLVQMDAATQILETAGRATDNDLGRALGPLSPNRTRVLGPSLFAHRREIEQNMAKAALAVVNRVNEELR
jgi:hypothetical protein